MRSQYESQNTPSGRGAETLAVLRLAENALQRFEGQENESG